MTEYVKQIPGIHHITAMCGDPQTNIDFYTGVLGLRLIKATVNFDDPGTYHLYYGDESGSPGTVLTFFAWPGAHNGRFGLGQALSCSYSIPPGSFDYWMNRLKEFGIGFEGPQRRFDEEFLTFRDPDGLLLELVEHNYKDDRVGWISGSVSRESAIRGFHSVSAVERQTEPTSKFLAESMGFNLIQESNGIVRLASGHGGSGAFIDLHGSNREFQGQIGVGSYHHIAWRTPNDEDHKAWKETIAASGHFVTPIIDRFYFHSIYFREPGGVLFEIATDQPGFAVDEPADKFGKEIKLPPWFESDRSKILQKLPPLDLKKVEQFQ